jgi:L-proline---[L-prolyl-carrier protein] ligase
VTATPELPKPDLRRQLLVADPAYGDQAAIVGVDPKSYAALARDVDALAVRLAGAGVHRGDRVAIWTDKGTRYAEAILATIRAGGAYVPLDGGQPAPRAAAILADSRPSVLVTDARRLAMLAGQAPVSPRVVILTDAEPLSTAGRVPVLGWTEALSAGGGGGLFPAGEDDLAAILYTSGSTGTPKGVQITHRNLTAFVSWARGELAVDAGDVFANHASFNFDLSTFDLFVALSVGAAVWIVPGEEARDVTALAEGLRRHGVTVLYCVPSVLNLLTASGALAPDVTAPLRYVLFAGEVFPLPQLRALASLLPERTRLYNLYGPTETNVCTYYQVQPADLAEDHPVPIGAPVSGARVTVVDADGQVVTNAGEVGELVVSGDCVTPGYWRREAESAAAGHRGGRHATGDLVSYRDDGQLVYHGRADRMIKLSGYRVELGEVEAAVLRHPSVAEAAVVVANVGGRPALTVYYTAEAGAGRPSLIGLKRHCASLLPSYMVPHTAVAVRELPRSANGKIDYRRLATAAADSLLEEAP